MTSVSAGTMIEFAYSVSIDRLENKPEWLYQTLYDVTAVTSSPSSKNRMPIMLQALLAERFHLKLRNENQMSAVYNLTPGKELKLQASKTPDEGSEAMFSPRLVPHADGTSETLWSATNASLAELAKWLSSQMSRPVQDRTEISGKFDFKLKLGHTDQAPSGGRSMFSIEDSDYISALRSQLGLKVENARAMIGKLVIVEIAVPDEN